ncbi:hypothetical protein HKD37_03G007175 [Glycine soja]
MALGLGCILKQWGMPVTSWKFLPGIFEKRYAEKREKLEPEKRHANRGRILAFQRDMWQSLNKIIEKEENLLFKTKSFSLSSLSPTKILDSSPSLSRSLLLLFSHPPLKPQQSSNLRYSFLLQIVKGEHFRSREVRGYEWDFENPGLGGLLSLLNFLVLFECCFAWMLWKLERIDGDPVLRETRIWATWEYVSSVGEWYLEICRGGQETLGTSGGVLLPKTKLDQSRPNPGIVGQLENEVRKLREPLIVMAAQLIRDRVEMECLEGAWETLEGNTRCRFRAPFDSRLLLWCIQMNLHGRFSARWSGQLLGLVLYIFEGGRI